MEVEYKQYQIIATARLPINSPWTATYEVRQSGRQTIAGTVAGGFHSSEEAESAAIGAGKAWVDKRTTRSD